jgi:hypothetical protein
MSASDAPSGGSGTRRNRNGCKTRSSARSTNRSIRPHNAVGGAAASAARAPGGKTALTQVRLNRESWGSGRRHGADEGRPGGRRGRPRGGAPASTQRRESPDAPAPQTAACIPPSPGYPDLHKGRANANRRTRRTKPVTQAYNSTKYAKAS